VGADAKNYDELAKVEKLKPMELELRKLEDLAVSIEKDFARMKQVEEKHRDTNGTSRLAPSAQPSPAPLDLPATGRCRGNAIAGQCQPSCCRLPSVHGPGNPCAIPAAGFLAWPRSSCTWLVSRIPVTCAALHIM